MSVVRNFLIVFLFFLSFWSQAQTQLVLLNHEKVLARYKVGSIITYKLKNSNEYLTSLILEVREFAIVTSFDTITFNRIDRVSLKGQPNKSASNLFGSFILVAGVAYFAFDQANSIIVHHAGYDNDPAVWKPAVIMVATGLLLKQIKKRSQRIRFPGRLLAAPPGSPFYEREE